MSQQNIPQNTNDVRFPHRLTLDSRASLAIEGVEDVVSFDENAALIRTSQGLLSIDGESLHVTALNLEDGQIMLDGHINALVYIDETASAGRRIFGRRTR